MAQINTIAIYGESGHGSVVADIALALGYKNILWIDDKPKNSALDFTTFCKQHPNVPVALGIGNNQLRQKISNRLKEADVTLATLIHPSAIVSPSAVIGEGSVIMPLAVVNANATIGQGSILNSACVVEHDVTLQDFVHISPQVALAGGVFVGEMSHIGIGSSVIQNITIGSNSTIGAGSSVVSDIPSFVTAVGVPCKVLR